MASNLADPDLATLETSEALGTNPNTSNDPLLSATSNATALVRPKKSLLNALPDELLIYIAAFMDPVSSMCFGLTSRKYHCIFHDVVDEIYRSDNPERRYNIRKYPFDLRMQVSTCDAQYIRHGWTEFWFLEDSLDIGWRENLGQLIAGEEGLWRGLTHCFGCQKYKPESAFSGFAFEREASRKYEKKLNLMDYNDICWYNDQCRRCRAKILLGMVEGRAQIFEEWSCPLEEKKSLGLLTNGRFDAASQFDVDDFGVVDGKEREPVTGEHVTWEDIFAKLHI